jgi:hypothetical protein
VRRGRRTLVGAVVAVSLILTTGCQYLPNIPSLPGNPFRSDPTPTVVPAAVPSPAPVAQSAAPAFTPFWIKNHRLTEMWSGPPGQPGVVSFGTTSQQFCSFQVVQPQNTSRLYVLNPYTNNYFWIDEDAIGRVDPPERRTGPKPANQNCADAIYEG